jgi:hypothetical protein
LPRIAKPCMQKYRTLEKIRFSALLLFSISLLRIFEKVAAVKRNESINHFSNKLSNNRNNKGLKIGVFSASSRPKRRLGEK